MMPSSTYKQIGALLEQAIALLPKEQIAESLPDMKLAIELLGLRGKLAKLQKSAERKERASKPQT
jgi:hypothetical protein